MYICTPTPTTIAILSRHIRDWIKKFIAFNMCTFTSYYIEDKIRRKLSDADKLYKFLNS
jgi:hypothetical protein